MVGGGDGAGRMVVTWLLLLHRWPVEPISGGGTVGGGGGGRFIYSMVVVVVVVVIVKSTSYIPN